MNSLQISCFLEAAKCRSFSRAAKNLYISQPTFSRNISTLENELGLTLFHRNSFHGIDLSESGEIMLAAFSQASETIDNALEKAHHLERSRSICMMLGLLEGQLLDPQLEDMIALFKREYPNITVKIRRNTYQELFSSLEKDELDLICMPEWQFPGRDSLTITPLGSMETILVVPRRLMPEAEDRIYSLKEFSRFPFIFVDESESRTTHSLWNELCDSLEIHPPLYLASSLQEQIQLVEMGEGIILINPYNSICYSPNVHRIKIRELKPQPFALAWKKTDAPESISLFQTFLQTYHSTA